MFTFAELFDSTVYMCTYTIAPPPPSGLFIFSTESNIACCTILYSTYTHKIFPTVAKSQIPAGLYVYSLIFSPAITLAYVTYLYVYAGGHFENKDSDNERERERERLPINWGESN